MNEGLPQGVRDQELTSFTTEHPNGVEVTFENVEDNKWTVAGVGYDSYLGNPSVLRAVDALIHDVKHHGDVVLV